MATVFIKEGGLFESMVWEEKLDLVIASVKNNKLKMVQFLVDTCGIGVQQSSSAEHTAILVAVKYAHLEIIEFLLGHSGDINQLYSGETLLHTATKNNYIAVVELLVTRGADPTTKNALGENVAQLAVRYDYVVVMKLLIEKGGVDVCVSTDRGTTFLHSTVKYNYLNMTKLLLEKGANADAPNAQGITPRAIAARYKYSGILALL
jgi:ankyrin repeat protein